MEAYEDKASVTRLVESGFRLYGVLNEIAFKFGEAGVRQYVNGLRQFAIPAGYNQWSEVLKTIGRSGNLDISKSPSMHSVNTCFWEYWVTENAPFYCLEASLLDDFLLTDTEKLREMLPSDWNPPFPLILLSLPIGKVLSPCEKHSVTEILIGMHHHSLNNFPARQENLFGSGITASFQVAGTYYKTHISFEKDGINFQEYSNETDDVRNFIRMIESICIQVVLVFSYIPNVVEQDDSLCVVSKKGGFSKSKQQTLLRPRWVKDAIPSPRKKEAISSQNSYPRSGPRTHIRRGHWRNLFSNDEERSKMTWVRPTIVCPQQ